MKRSLPIAALALLLVACTSTSRVVSPPPATDDTLASTDPEPSPSRPERCSDAVGPLPAPTGEHSVGTADVPGPASLGHLVAFYPVDACTAARPTYLRGDLIRALGLEPSLVDRIVVPASVDAPPSITTPRPVVVLAPGWTSMVALSTSLAIDLASHGYVVVTWDPPLGSESTTFPDAAAASARLEALGDVLDIVDGPTVEALTGPLDRSRVAAGGHSYAGSIAFQRAQSDERIAAVFDLDGVLHDSTLSSPMPVPSLIIASSGQTTDDASLSTVLAQSPLAVGVSIDDTDHYDLTDVPALASVLGTLTASLAQGTRGADAIGITNGLVQRFLDCAIGTSATDSGRCSPTSTSLIDGRPGLEPLDRPTIEGTNP